MRRREREEDTKEDKGRRSRPACSPVVLSPYRSIELALFPRHLELHFRIMFDVGTFHLRAHPRLLAVILKLGHKLILLVDLVLLSKQDGKTMNGGTEPDGEISDENPFFFLSSFIVKRPTFSSSTRWISPRSRLISCRLWNGKRDVSLKRQLKTQRLRGFCRARTCRSRATVSATAALLLCSSRRVSVSA